MSLGRIIRAEAEGPARLPLLGRLKIGEKVKKMKDGREIEYPTSLDYFRADGKYAAKFHEVYGDRPSKVEIVFFSPNVADVCSESYVVRDKAGRLLAEGNGQTWRCWSASREEYVFGETTLEEVEKKYASSAQVKDGHAAAISLTLRFVMPRISRVYGIWQLTTKGSRSSIPAIRDTFDSVAEMAGALITNIPFDLTIEKVKSNRPGSSSIFPVLCLIPNVSKENLDLVAEMKLEGQRIRGLLTEDRIKKLSATIEAAEDDEPGLPALPAASSPAPADAPPPSPADKVSSLFPEEVKP